MAFMLKLLPHTNKSLTQTADWRGDTVPVQRDTVGQFQINSFFLPKQLIA